MESAIAERLIDLNRQFYQTFAVQFSATRQRIQPGVRRLLPELGGAARLLDLGCGNGSLWLALQAAGFGGKYLGLDFSPGLLQAAANPPVASPEVGGACAPVFAVADLAHPGWEAQAAPAAPFEAATAFAMLHHLPSQALRLAFLTTLARLLPSGGHFYHSHWQFLNSPRLQARILPWETVGLDPAQLEPDDYLLDWRAGGVGLRYVHHFRAAELTDLAGHTGFHLNESFVADGHHGNLALYQIWGKN